MAIVDKNIDKEPKWYVLHVFSGYENIAKQNLEITIEKYALQDRADLPGASEYPYDKAVVYRGG